MFGLRPKSVLVDFSEKFTGRLQIAFKGGAYVLLVPSPATFIAERSLTTDDFKDHVRRLIFNAAHRGSDDDKQVMFSSLGFPVHAGFLREKCALIVPPGWVCAMATPESQEGSLVGASAPFFDVSLETCKTVKVLMSFLGGAASASFEDMLKLMPESVISKLKDESERSDPSLEAPLQPLDGAAEAGEAGAPQPLGSTGEDEDVAAQEASELEYKKDAPDPESEDKKDAAPASAEEPAKTD